MKVKSLTIPAIYVLVLFMITIGIYFTKKAFDEQNDKIILDNITFVSKSILNKTLPVMNVTEESTIIKPYTNENVMIKRSFYESSLSDSEKEKALVFYQGTYMQNTGIDYGMEDAFEVVAIYDGTVIDLLDDELLGKTVKIKHNNELISVYQGIDNVEVKKGDIVVLGQKIATSGVSKINMDLGKHLHFEVYYGGQTINPTSIYDKKLGDI